ncbi:membrane protein [Haloactinospora alba]|uniref:Membrane protein n=1 Tax=Haloactinospora alba TaxID=405555 RepID=A0A543NM92_9ACTN|nr:YihY/virulence factor BrkB family protein [Haloactinospora alba]TQN32948.1 membrane protein [Haloactinospora alba]
MASVLGRVKARAREYANAAADRAWSARQRWPVLDHAVRAYERYADSGGNQLAGSVTYFVFLSFFPLLALAFAIAGYAAVFQDEAREYLDQAIRDVLPGLANELPVDRIAEARAGAGAGGLLGLLYAGLGSVSALRVALHRVWLKNVSEGPNIVVAKLLDIAVMVVLGLALLASVALTSVAQAATDWLLAWVGLADSALAGFGLRVLGFVVAIAMSLVIFLVLFAQLSGTRSSWRVLWRGALLTAVGFEVLKSLGAVLVGGTLSNPVYASFAVLVGLLVWINLVSRVVLFGAAWTATWLPVLPPYQGTTPVAMPAGATATDPARPEVHPQDSVRYSAVLPSRPTAERVARSRGRARRRALARVARRLAAPAAVVAAAVWIVANRRRRARRDSART